MRPGSNPAANVEVVLSNSSGNPIAYTFTDSEGTYVFDHLPYGNYSVQAEMTGRSTEPVVVNLTENSVKANINFVVNEAAINIVGITEPVKSTLLAGNLYPNPVGEILNLKLNASVSGTVVVDIIDVQSRIIHSESISLSGGNNLISIPTGKLTKGIYLLSVKSKGHNPVQRKFIK